MTFGILTAGAINPELNILGALQQFNYNQALSTLQVNNSFIPTSLISAQTNLEFRNNLLSGFRWIHTTSNTDTYGSLTLTSFVNSSSSGTNVININNSGVGVYPPLLFYNSTGTNYVALQAGSLGANTTWTLPITDGLSGQALITNGSGSLSWSSTGVGSVTSITAGTGLSGGTITTSGTISLITPVTVVNGGTGNTSAIAYSVLCGGTTSTGAFQSVASVGTTNQVLTSQGASSLPTWTSLSSLGVSSLTGTTNQISVSSSIGAITISLPAGISIGSYQATTPPTGGLLMPGNLLIGTTTPVSTSVIYAVVPDTIVNTNTSFILAATTGGNTYQLRAGVSATNGYAWISGVQAGIGGKPLYLNGLPGIGINVVPLSALDVNGGLAVGTYAGVNTAPSNGLIVSGKVGIGTSSLTSAATAQFSTTTSGSASVQIFNSSSVYSNQEFSNAPFEISTGVASSDYTLYMGADKTNNCAYIQSVRVLTSVTNLILNGRGGNVGIFDITPGSKLSVVGNAQIGFASGTVAPSNGLIVSGNVAIGTSGISGQFTLGGSSSSSIIIYNNTTLTTTTPASDLYGEIHYNNFTYNSGATLAFATGMYLACRCTVNSGASLSFATTLQLVAPTNAGAASVANARTLQVAAPTIGSTSNSALYAENAIIGSPYNNITPPSNGLIISGNVGIGTSSPSANAKLTSSSTLTYNVLLQGSQTAQTSNNQICLSIQSTLAPAAAITGYVAGIANTPTITIPNVTNPAIASAYGEYISLTINGTSGKTLTTSYGIFVGAGSLATATVTTTYGGYFTKPGFGTNITALYADNMSIGYTATTPPNNSLIVSGNVGINTPTPTTNLDVNGNVRRLGNINVTETITAAGALSTSKDSIIDTRNSSYIVTLGYASFTDQIKSIRLLTRNSLIATVQCNKGRFDLTSSSPIRNLYYGLNGWECQSSYNSSCPDSFYCTTQEQLKLVGTGNTGAAEQGYAVALSSDGNTLAVSGASDNTNQGACWIFVRTPGLPLIVYDFQQQGSKLVGTGNTGAAYQGFAVALSSDGNTLAMGAPGDNTDQGACWIFTRSGSTWTQQGSKLVGTGNTGAAYQGQAVALSSDGNTLAMGGSGDNTNQGACWIFTRSGSTWSQYGSKLIGTGNTGTAQQGSAVALSSDGNTLAMGGPSDNTNQGACWIFTRSDSTWSQYGSKLIGTGNTGAAHQGTSVSLSSDGFSLAIGGNGNNSVVGAVWTFYFINGSWTQKAILIPSDNTGSSSFGQSIQYNSNANSLAIGGNFDNTLTGAAWVFI